LRVDLSVSFEWCGVCHYLYSRGILNQFGRLPRETSIEVNKGQHRKHVYNTYIP